MKSIFIKTATPFIVISILFANCATIVSKSAYPVYIHTDPAGANISITDKKGKEIYKGISPATVTLNSGAGYFTKAEYQVKLSSPGYTEKIVTINYKLNGWYFGNILIGGILGMLIVDPITGAMWKISDPAITETLESTSSSASIAPTLNIVNIKDVTVNMKSKLVKIN